MTEEQKKYIEENRNLIKNDEWEKFFEYAPYGIGGLLYEAGINFLEKLNSIPSYSFYDSNIQTINIPSNIMSIENRAFSNCSKLERITMFDGVTSIGNYAFEDCTSLTSIKIPNSVKSISNGAFCYCKRLTSIELTDSVTRISRSAFARCTNLKSIEIPNGVTKIDAFAFDFCVSLKSITIPYSVKSIQVFAFAHCNNIEIKYGGTTAEWRQLIINNKIFQSTTYTCNCTDGVVTKSR